MNLLMIAISEMQKAGQIVAVIDRSDSFNIHTAKTLGVDTTKLLFASLEDTTQAAETVNALIRSGSVDKVFYV